MTNDVLVVLCTCPSGDPPVEIARGLVERGHAACVNIVPAVQSIYRWDDQIQQDAETLLMIKTTQAQFTELQAALIELHPYEVPEIIGLPLAGGSGAYLDWVRNSVGQTAG